MESTCDGEHKIRIHSRPCYPQRHCNWQFRQSPSLARWTARRLDRPVLGTIHQVVLPGLFWIPARIKANQPFLTSMLARLPWRVIAASLALSTGTAAGLAFAAANLLWAIGDIAIGTLDFQPEDVPAERVSET